MNSIFFLTVFSFLGIFYLLLGIWSSKKISTVEDYFLAGRDLGLWPLTLTLVATQIGGGMLLGSANAAYVDGYFGVFYTLGMSIGFIILGFGLASKLRQFNVATTAELFEVKYGSQGLRKFASIISALSMVGLLAGQVVASRALFQALGISHEGALLLFWVFVITYTVVGGLKAVVITDIFQVVFLVFIVLGVFVFVFFIQSSLINQLVATAGKHVQFASPSKSFISQLPVFLTSALYPLFGQDLSQRFFAARTKRIAASSALLSAVIMVLFSFIPVYFGMQARFLGLSVPASTSAFIVVLKVLTNNVVLALIGCALIAAITSTADSLLCAISSNITQDFNYSFISEKQKLNFSKIITFFAGALGIYLAYYSNNILGVLAQSYGLLISCLFASVFFCFFTDHLRKSAASFSIAGGSISFIIFKLFSFGLSPEIHAIGSVVFPLLVSFICYGIGYLRGVPNVWTFKVGDNKA